MVRLPQPGADQGQWGDILNDFLRQVHTSTGSLKPNSVANETIADEAVSEAKLNSSVRAKLNTVGGTPLVESVAGKTGQVTLAKNDVGLANVDNTSDEDKPISTAVQAALDTKQLASQKAQANGFASLDANSRVPAAQLGTGTANSTTYLRGDGSWQTVGSATINAASISDSTLTGRALITASDATSARTALNIENVNNTSDVDKPISSATQAALNTKVQLSGDQIISGTKNFTGNLQFGGQTVVTTDDSRLTNQRIPTDNSVTVEKISAGQANQDQILAYDGSNLVWTTVTSNGTVPDASSAEKGIVQLAGDLAGTAASPIVAKVRGVSIAGTPTTGQLLTATSTTSASWQTPASPTAISSADITDSTTTGRSLLTSNNAAAARTVIGAGTSDLVIGTTSTTAKAGNYIPTKTDVGLANVDNTSDENKPISTATQTALNAKQNTSAKGLANGYASLDGNTRVPTTQLGSGTASTSTYLRGDGSWQPVAGGGSGPYITPEQFGAQGDGVTDDTDALKDAIDAAHAAQSAVYLTEGKKYRGRIDASNKHLHLIGQGALVVPSGSGSGIVAAHTPGGAVSVSNNSELIIGPITGRPVPSRTLTVSSATVAAGSLNQFKADDVWRISSQDIYEWAGTSSVIGGNVWKAAFFPIMGVCFKINVSGKRSAGKRHSYWSEF